MGAARVLERRLQLFCVFRNIESHHLFVGLIGVLLAPLTATGNFHFFLDSQEHLFLELVAIYLGSMPVQFVPQIGVLTSI